MSSRTARKRSGTARGDAARLVEVVRSFEGRPVAVLGDLVADEFVYGDIARISREAPVLILEHRKTVVVPGGAGNAVANLRALGADPIPVGIVGRDAAGQQILREFEKRGISCAGILVRAEHTTPCKSRLLAGGVHTRRQQIVRVDRGAPAPLSPSAQSGLDRKLRTALRRAEALLVADYGYGAATPESVVRVADQLRRQELPVLVDSRSRVAAYRGATACTPNQEELERALDVGPLSDDEVDGAGRRLLRRTGGQAVLVTRGARGASLLQRGRSPVHVPAYGTDEVADVTGAGDTVIAVFTLALIAGADFQAAARLSNYAAGLVVMKAGTATIDRPELIRAIHEDLGD